MAKRKKASRREEPTPVKKPHTDPTDLINWDQEKPSWCFSILDIGGPWSCNKASKQVLCEDIFPKLKDFESMTWAEIKGPRHKIIPFNDLPPGARRRLTEIEQDDVEGLFELRLGGKPRIWGILKEAKLRILWWDPEHTVYPSRKKRT